MRSILQRNTKNVLKNYDKNIQRRNLKFSFYCYIFVTYCPILGSFQISTFNARCGAFFGYLINISKNDSKITSFPLFGLKMQHGYVVFDPSSQRPPPPRKALHCIMHSSPIVEFGTHCEMNSAFQIFTKNVFLSFF